MKSALLQPFTLGDLQLRNRIVLAPMTRARAGSKRLANPLMVEYYAQRSSAGLALTEATVVSEQGIGFAGTPGIYTEAQAASWKLVTEAVHKQGGTIFLQLWHCGRASHRSFQPNGELPVSASAVLLEGDMIHTPIGKQPYETPRALELGEIPALIESYRQAAARARTVGFDGIEIHAANGYLLDQFLQSKTNHRDDAYGGTVDNRVRLLREVTKAVTTVFPSRRVGVRLSPNGSFNDMGSPDFRETFLHAARELDSLDLAYLHVVDGLVFGFHRLGEPMTLAEFRGVFRNPLIGNCGYTREKGEKAIELGAADLIAYGRPYISNPDLVERFANHWPLNPQADMSTWYAGDLGAQGYTDFPAYQPSPQPA